jgi:beta-lactamase regulating signal transducer with metallopeptidase domain
MLTALIRASLEGAVLVAGIWSIGKLWPRLSAGARTMLWWCAAAKFLLAIIWVTPIELRILPAAAVSESVAFGFSPKAAAGAELPAEGGSHQAAPIEAKARVDWTPFVLGVWLTGVVLALTLGARRWRNTLAIVSRAEPAPHETQLLALDVARALGLRRGPPVRVSTELATPIVAGVLEPAVVLPADRFARLPLAEQRMVLCHELAHVKRGDLWLGCVPALAERIFFFHPLVRLAAREYALCREAACDAAVIITLNTSPQDYGRLLLALGVIPGRTAAAAAGASWSFSTLKRRITMLGEHSTHSPGTRAIAAAAVAAAILAMVPLRLTARPETAAAAAAAALPAPAQSTRTAADEPRELLNYVLFEDGDTTHTSGTREDVRAARQYRRNGERLLWFRHRGGEYVLSDRGVIDQALAVWRPVGEIGEEMGKIGQRQGALGAQQGEIGARQGRIGQEQGALGAKQGALGARQGVLSARQMVAFSDGAKREIDAEFRKIDDEMKALDRQMRELDGRMRELERPMGALNDQMEGLNREMEKVSRRMDVASKKAKSEMAALIERAVSTGVATAVK